MIFLSSPLKYNFYKIVKTQNWQRITYKPKPNTNSFGNKILRFRKPNKFNKFSFIIESSSNNHNLSQFKSIFILRLSFLSSWVRRENYDFSKNFFLKSYIKQLWSFRQNWNLAKNEETLCLNQFKPVSTFVYFLRFLSRNFQFYFFKLAYLRFNGISYLSKKDYWQSFNYVKFNLSIFGIGSYVNRVSYKNAKFSFLRSKPSLILNKTNTRIKLELPSKKVIFLESQFGNARLNGAFASNKVRKENLLSKASAKFYSNKKPFVKGKAMNVFDRPNGGFKHSSKLLKTFKGRKILK